MKETRADTAQAIGLALVLHLALFALLFVGLWWTRSAAPAAAGAISAELMDTSQLSSAMLRTLRDKPEPVVEEVEPEPLPEPVAESQPQPKPQDFIPVPDDVDQVAVTEQPTPTPAIEEKVQEAKQRQEQVDLTEQTRQQEAQKRERLTAMEQERLKQLEDIRRRRAAAARDADLAEQRLQQLASARSRNAAEAAAQSDAQVSGSNGTDDGLRARYAAALQAAILSKWTRPDSVPIGASCRLHIRQLPGGEVMGVEVSSPCAYDEQGRRSVEAAVLKAQPLPYAGFEPVFSRDLTLNFRAEDR
ncbi:MAG TPA: cell envelope integrity protein TolA [Lysobacter sp.]|nr:cell envelope integrity protein TolA [Lysobacter sp.]